MKPLAILIATLALAACEEATPPITPAAAAPPATSAPDPATAAKVIELTIAADGADQRVEQAVGGNASNLVAHTLSFPADFSAGVAHQHAGKGGYLDHWFRFTSTARLEALTNEELERQSGVSIEGRGRTWHLLSIEPSPDFHIALIGTLGGDPATKPAPQAAARLEVVLSADLQLHILTDTLPTAQTTRAHIEEILNGNPVQIRVALR